MLWFKIHLTCAGDNRSTLGFRKPHNANVRLILEGMASSGFRIRMITLESGKTAFSCGKIRENLGSFQHKDHLPVGVAVSSVYRRDTTSVQSIALRESRTQIPWASLWDRYQ